MAWYRTGTVAVTNGSATITGTGTAWVANAAVGHGIVLPDGRIYEVAAVVSNTQITLATSYLGSTASGQSYMIVPTRGPELALLQSVAALLETYGAAFLGVGQGNFADGTAAAPGLRFAADQNTGMRRIGTDVLALVTGGVDRFQVTNSGAVLAGLLTGTAVTQSQTDTTAGRLLKVGDFGLGASGPLVATNVDLIAANGFYRLTTGAFSAASPTPGLGSGQYLVHYNWDGNAAHQVLYTFGTGAPSPFERAKVSGVWTPWHRSFNGKNILGTVSQAAGVPTGAVIESGANANGNYTRFADGTQMCQAAVGAALTPNVATGSIFSSPEYTWTFPAAFATATIAVTCSPRNAADVWGRARVTSATQGAAKLMSAAVTTATTIDLFAIGRWF